MSAPHGAPAISRGSWFWAAWTDLRARALPARKQTATGRGGPASRGPERVLRPEARGQSSPCSSPIDAPASGGFRGRSAVVRPQRAGRGLQLARRRQHAPDNRHELLWHDRCERWAQAAQKPALLPAQPRRSRQRASSRPPACAMSGAVPPSPSSCSITWRQGDRTSTRLVAGQSCPPATSQRSTHCSQAIATELCPVAKVAIAAA